MRVYADLGTHDPTGTLPSDQNRLIKYDVTPEKDESTNINGQYVLEVPEGASINIDENSYITPQNAGSVSSQAAQEFLVRYPMYDHVLFNFFIDNDDIDAIDMSLSVPVPTSTNTTPPLGAFPNPPSFSRCKIGRSAGPASIGMVPNRLEILPRSFRKVNNVYGCVISKVSDITSFNPTTPGTDEVMVWWRIAKMETSHDVNDGPGGPPLINNNVPSINTLTEIDQEPLDFAVWVSNDGGTKWYETPRLEPVDLVNVGTDIRIAFVNRGDDPVYLLGYCILFPDLP